MMNLSRELILGLGFKSTTVKEFNMEVDMYSYCINDMEPLYLEKVHVEKEFYTLYKKDISNTLVICGNCSNLASLIELMMKVNQTESVEIGKKLKQNEIKSALGLM